MRLISIVLFLALATGASAAAQKVARPVSAPIHLAILGEENAASPEISTEELRRLLASGHAVVIDTRPLREYSLGHIPGALTVAAKPGMAMSQYTSDVAEIERLVGGRKDRLLVLYCNGPFCGKSKRVAEELLSAGFTNVWRYQLGVPVWRALGGVVEMTHEGVEHILRSDHTAVFIDSRSRDFGASTLPGARNVPLAEVAQAKDDGRLPMEDHNTRIVVFGRNAAEARATAEAIARHAFHNVAYFAGSFSDLPRGDW